MMKSAENARIQRVVRRLGCYERLLREMLQKKVTKETIEAHGTYKELKQSVNKKKATDFFIVVERNRFQPERLAMYVDRYLRAFILSGGVDPYPDVEFEQSQKKKESDNQNSNNNGESSSNTETVGVVLTEEDMHGKTVTMSVKSPTLSEWYSSSKAIACMMDTGCFAYMENKLCVNDKKYIERGDDGRLHFTQYALDNEEECFLQFILDDEGKLHYVTLPKSLANKSFRYYDEITEEMAVKLGLVNEISREMLTAINGCEFGEALTKLMSKNICGFSAGLLKSTTGIDNRTYSNMKKGKNLNKLNVVSTCLGIHVPFPVSNRMLELAELPLNLSLPGQKGEDNRQYDLILHLKWATDYDDIYIELQDAGYDYLIHQPPK